MPSQSERSAEGRRLRATTAESAIKDEAMEILDAVGPEGQPAPDAPPPTMKEMLKGGGMLHGMVRQTLTEHLHPAVGADRSGGFEDETRYGEGAETASPAAPKAYEALVVAQSEQSKNDEPLINQVESKEAEDERERERQTPTEGEGRKRRSVREGRQMRVRFGAAVLASVVLWLGALGARGASPGTNPFTSAIIKFPPDSGIVESGVSPTAAGVFYFICWPPGDSETNTTASGSLDVAPDGTLGGSCIAARGAKVASNGTGGTIVAKRGSLTGRFDPAAQRVEFHLDATSTYTSYNDPGCEACPEIAAVFEYHIVVDGPVSGGDVVGDRADGRARYTHTCAVIGGGSSASCGGASSHTGTVAFELYFLPALPTEPPAAGAGTTADGTGGGGESPFVGPLAFLVFFLVLMAAVVAYVRAQRARLARAAQAARPPWTREDESTADDLWFLEKSAEEAARKADAPREVQPAPAPGAQASVSAAPAPPAKPSAVTPPAGRAPAPTQWPKEDESTADDLWFLEKSAEEAARKAEASKDAQRGRTPEKPSDSA